MKLSQQSQQKLIIKPKPVPAEKVSDDKFGGVSVKWFPKSSDHGAIVEFLVGNGLPQGHENVNIKGNGQVIISLLDPSICRKMMTEINGKKFNKKNIYCNGIVPVSPKKGAQSSAQSQSSKTTNTEPKEANPTEAPPPPPTNSTVKDLVKELEKKKKIKKVLKILISNQFPQLSLNSLMTQILIGMFTMR